MSRFEVELRKLFCGLIGFAVLALPTLALSSQPHTPESIPGVTTVTAEKAKALVESGVMIVDARVANEYVEQHVKGAVNIPYKEQSAKSVDFNGKLDSFDLAKLPADKDTQIIFYCNAGECWKSYKACVTAGNAGYKNIYWLRGGIPEWKAKGFPVE